VNGYAGPKNRGGGSGTDNSIAFKELEESFKKLKKDYEESKENNALMF